ncbi:MAG: putative tRNA sulfurtransferase [Caldanaerobacter subterraneus]|uniref:Probable tRNA sulfurtransferase n=2 Tax=Caldanaerobacter subterraneus TaxID=911092 RepID=THII_CALS4|nr:tRNA uracil 4-sulfurtransferase ThiI [Caldanaerobacter subterraneus]Q8R9F0.1 RecName: Full=Probable tRNA sulfurtransferase; AltName: Full=Sulfur carrier protein ThiS sulfurtransferase; AltName: Full=Thiamine biosynthesis protein ThiI; AltName: Full=tRNA 4-thiouridine synthase [Caldanaerobacter subterraneus subsp. tengcongensis MB4]AAM24864.1 Thiamine biosynthesis ATP pyrophosphatase [Caldanaerobacter subterraneus subsp. tengcongensis MB4]KUK08439.1 MAG: putative tRNA sulfurtransferase [Caldan
MKDVLLIKYGELALKGENRSFFENTLVKNIKYALRDFDGVKVEKTHGRIYVECEKDVEEAIERLKKVFGIVGITRAKEADLDLEEIFKAAVDLMKSHQGKTFKVETKRPNKAFPYNSMEVSRRVGAAVLKNVKNMKVDVHNPDVLLNVEIREKAFLYAGVIEGAGGLPLGTNGKATVLLSGGIDSPVAAWMMMKRGVEVEAVYFHSPPYTSDRAKEKVVDLCKVLSQYGRGMRLHVVHFTDLQLEIYEKCPARLTTIIMRRMMMKIAEKIAQQNGSLALITGESLGQVASQTIESLYVTNSSVSLPVFRPLIGMDKREIIDIAQKIGTYEISIRPYEDCCTIFVPKHPATKPKLEKVLEAEEKMDYQKFIDNFEEEVIEI